MEKEIEKKFLHLEIILSEFVALNCLYKEEKTWHQHTVC